MSTKKKSQAEILQKLGIAQLNDMQEEALLAIKHSPEVVLLSPTGTGKTLAFLLPLIEALDPKIKEVQALIIAPSRELAIQIGGVTKEMGSGFKTNTFYGGRNFSKDRLELSTRPAILVGTPGRIADHLYRQTFITDHIKIFVLDEFDKSLEVGFEDEMKEITHALHRVEKKILTSATDGIEIPDFLNLTKPLYVNHLADRIDKLKVVRVVSPEKDKLTTLEKTLSHIGNKPGIIFCNFKDSIKRISDFLTERGIDHGCFYGGLEQIDRERALLKFRNGTHQIIIATDLAARGIDVPEIKFIIHYHLPMRSEEFTHRNGRTARMGAEGKAYVLHWEEENLPDFVTKYPEEKLDQNNVLEKSNWSTLYISAGRKDKISKGDIAGFIFKKGLIEKEDIGIIEIKQDCSFTAVAYKKANSLVDKLDQERIKKKKVRVKIV